MQKKKYNVYLTKQNHLKKDICIISARSYQKQAQSNFPDCKISIPLFKKLKWGSNKTVDKPNCYLRVVLQQTDGKSKKIE